MENEEVLDKSIIPNETYLGQFRWMNVLDHGGLYYSINFWSRLHRSKFPYQGTIFIIFNDILVVDLV